MSEIDPNLSPPGSSLRPFPPGHGLTGFLKRVGETSFYRKALAYRPAFLRGALGVAIAMLVQDKDHPGDVKGTILAGLIAWRLFIDSSMGQARDEVNKIR